MKQLKKSTKIALAGTMAALCVVLMFLTGLFPFATLAIPALAGLLIAVMVVELGPLYAAMVYASSALLSFLVTPDLEASLVFCLFFGYYPLIKYWVERRRMKKAAEYLLKLLCCNLSMALLAGISLFVWGISYIAAQAAPLGGVWVAVAVVAAVGNGVFLLFDVALTRVISAYILWFRPKYLRR